MKQGRAASCLAGLLFLLALHPALHPGVWGQAPGQTDRTARTDASAREARATRSAGTALSGPGSASYLTARGEIRIVGYNDMEPMLERIDELYRTAHPATSFALRLKGTATAAGALTLGVSAVAPMGAEFSEQELRAYRALVGGEPLQIRVAHCSMNPAARSAPIGIYANSKNPLSQVTVEQVARVFTTGQPGGDLTAWSQLIGDPGWKGKTIHACGIAREEAAGISPYMLAKMGNHAYTPTYTPLLQSRDVVACVAADPFAIGFASANFENAATKLLAVGMTAGGPFVRPEVASLMRGSYPFDRFLYLYVRNVPGQGLDPFVREYVRLMLSPEGQKAVAAAAPGYLPLNPSEIAAELARLDAVHEP